jgi:hypothetical protein
MEALTAMCGCDCSTCEAYQATQAKDENRKAEIASNWQKAFGKPQIDKVYVTCGGCLSGGEPLGGHCLECDLRACGLGHQVSCCAYCPEFGCARLETFLSQVPGLRFSLEELRSHL